MDFSGTPLPAVGIALTAALAIAGCGNSGSSGLSKAQLNAKASAICSAATANQPAQPQDFTTNSTAAAAYLDKLLTVITPATNQMAALKPTSSLKAQFAAYVATLRQELALVESADRKAHAHDPSGIQDIQRASSFASQAKSEASALGFTGCMM
jgi:hypothetical protein